MAEDKDIPSGLKRRTVDATPRVADLFRGYARGGYSIPDAIAEYVDNSIEQLGDRAGGKIEVTFAASGAGVTTVIKDNGGGCRDTDALRFIQPGNTGTTELSRGISRFGMGGKTAGLSVAKQVRVFSKFPGEAGFFVVLDRQELMSKPNWNFEIYDIPVGVSINSGETIVELRGMSTEAHARRESYRTRFADRYAALLRKKDAPALTVDGTQILARDPDELMLKGPEAPPGCSPAPVVKEHFYPLPSGDEARREKVIFRLTVGMGASGSTTPDKGARIYCNGRAVGGVNTLGMSTDEDDSLHTSDDLTWLRAVVDLEGPAELMPWTNRKDRLDPSSPSYRDLEAELKASYNRFLEGAIAPAKERLRAERGRGSKAPRLAEVMEAFWRRQIERSNLNPKTVRQLLKDAPMFQRATRPITSEEAPEPPSVRDRGIDRLQANVDATDVIRAKELIESHYRIIDPENSEVVRILLRHFLECSEVARPSPASEGGSGPA